MILVVCSAVFGRITIVLMSLCVDNCLGGVCGCLLLLIFCVITWCCFIVGLCWFMLCVWFCMFVFWLLWCLIVVTCVSSYYLYVLGMGFFVAVGLLFMDLLCVVIVCWYELVAWVNALVWIWLWIWCVWFSVGCSYIVSCWFVWLMLFTFCWNWCFLVLCLRILVCLLFLWLVFVEALLLLVSLWPLCFDVFCVSLMGVLIVCCWFLLCLGDCWLFSSLILCFAFALIAVAYLWALVIFNVEFAWFWLCCLRIW